ncbi:hypothetical protein CALCODRAFT_505466 [Calocera cornea HHB12733]|uniref:Uncharacterized protein n=1 Tax=Calocera cornea HHB12733 TaxID=1353952 RepID=A0A165K5I6_9BASI|nr:hypothetical protein CALCODRAFT_505466 [Calocera cornea HHB12733]
MTGHVTSRSADEVTLHRIPTNTMQTMNTGTVAFVVPEEFTPHKDNGLLEVLQAVQRHIYCVKLEHPDIWPNARRDIEASIIQDQRQILENPNFDNWPQYTCDIAIYEDKHQQCLRHTWFAYPTEDEVRLWWEIFGDQL